MFVCRSWAPEGGPEDEPLTEEEIAAFQHKHGTSGCSICSVDTVKTPDDNSHSLNSHMHESDASTTSSSDTEEDEGDGGAVPIFF